MFFLCSPASGGEPYVISSSPSISKSSAEEVFVPLAAVLSNVTGKKFTYKHPANWSSYIRDMRRSAYDVLFDESHMVSWRIRHLEHAPLVKLAGSLNYVIISRDNDDLIVQLKDLAGYPVCTRSPPMLEGLILFDQFTDPNRQPLPLQIETSGEGFEKLLAGGCRGAILPASLYEELAAGSDETRILYLSEPFPNWAFSTGPSVSEDMRNAIARHLLDAEDSRVAERLSRQTGTGSALLRASRTDYIGYDYLLNGFWALR